MKLLCIIFMLILLASPIHANIIVNKYTNDFSLTSPYTQDLKACSCELRTDEYTVKNTGNFLSNYQVIVHSNTNWFRPSITDFSLAQGEELTFLVYAEPGCVQQQEQEYIVQVKSSFGREQSVKKTLDVRKCQNLFFVINPTQTTNVADPIVFSITTRNVADFTDTFLLDFGTQNVVIDKSTFTLSPDQSLTLNATLYPPKDFVGELKLLATLTSEKNKIQEQKEHTFTIENRYDHAVLLDTSLDVCSRVSTQHTILLQNFYSDSNTYNIQVDGPNFIRNLQSVVAAGPLEEKNITLAINPKHGDEGRYTTSISVVSDYGKITKQRDFELNVLDCFEFEVSSPLLQDTTCCGEKNYELTVLNKGLAEETYNIIVDGPAWFTSDVRTIRLAPSEKTNIQFVAQLPCTDELYDVPVHVVLNSHPDLVQTVTFHINSQHQLTCHEVTAKLDTVKIDEQDTLIPIIISSTGIAAGTYNVSINSRIHASIQENSITLSPGDNAVIHILNQANITDYSDGKYLSHLTITQGDLEYIVPFITKFNHVNGLGKFWNTLRSYNYSSIPLCVWLVILLTLVTILIIIWLLFNLTGRKFNFQRGMTEESLFTMRLITVAFLLISIIALLLIPLPNTNELYESSIDDTSGLVMQWNENEEYIIDLNRYFNDLDGDSLDYSATQPAHIRVIIEGQKATLQPQLNWAGQENLVFTATDRKGTFVDSPIFLLNVRKHTSLSFAQWVMRHCYQLSMGLIIVSLLVFLLITIIGITPVVFYPNESLTRPAFTPTPKVRYVAATSGSKVHLTNCPIAQRIPKNQEVTFLSKTAAKKEGYTACKRCKPFN